MKQVTSLSSSSSSPPRPPLLLLLLFCTIIWIQQHCTVVVSAWSPPVPVLQQLRRQQRIGSSNNIRSSSGYRWYDKTTFISRSSSSEEESSSTTSLNMIMPTMMSMFPNTIDDVVVSTAYTTATAAAAAAAAATAAASSSSSSSSLVLLSNVLDITRDQGEALAGPFFGLSLFPYLVFLYLLDVKENDTPKGVTVGFATCLLFVFLTIPAAITSQLWYGVSLADSDWLHGSAESLLTITNLITVIAFRQALNAKETQLSSSESSSSTESLSTTSTMTMTMMPKSATSYFPMTVLVVVLTLLAGVTAAIPAFDATTTVHTPYLGKIIYKILSLSLCHFLLFFPSTP